jgi:N-acetylglucosamine-6-sulfatase
MNGNTVKNAVSKPVAGFNASDILLDPFTYVFYNASYSSSGGPPEQRPGEYSTDRIRDIGLGYIEEAAKHDQPFFIGSL